jgi:MFS transporter, putative metabolite:H+ symporter
MTKIGMADSSSGHAEVIRDIAARIERLPFSRWHLKARILIGTATFFDAFDALTIAQIIPVLRPLWNLSGTQAGLLISTGYLGQLVGAILAGIFAERWGRLPIMIGAIILMSVMSLLCAFAWNYESLLAFRTIQGLGLGGQVPIAAAYISEIAKAHKRGRFFILYECVFTFGLFASGLIGSFVVPHLGWEAMFFIGILPIVIGVSLGFLMPESPRWLASRNRVDDARAAMARIECEIEASTGKKLAAPTEWVPVDTRKPSWRDVAGPDYIKRTVVVWVIWFATFLITYGLGTWLPTLYRTVFALPLETALRFGTVGSLMQLAGGLTAGFVIDRTGRRGLFMIAFFGAAAALFSLCLVGMTSVAQFVVLSGTAYYFAGLSVLGIYLYTPEIYPTRARAFGTALGTAWLRLASMIGPLIVGFFVAGGIGTVFLVFASAALIAGIVVALLAVETTNRSLEDISR